MSRRPIIAGNWKMNKDINEAAALINELKPLVEGAEAEVVFCPPYVDLVEAVKLTMKQAARSLAKSLAKC